MKKSLALTLGLASLACMAAPVSTETLIRTAPMKTSPKIDGKISPGEWIYASFSFGGVERKSNFMTVRRNCFRFGYDKKNFYFSISSEIPRTPLKLNSQDQVEFFLQAPGSKNPVRIAFDSTGKGTLPKGVKVAGGFAVDIVTGNRKVCWNTEVKVPVSLFGRNEIKNGETWGIQAARHWSSSPETGYFHHTKKADELGTFITDFSAPAVSFDGFGYLSYDATGNYSYTVRVENGTNKPVTVFSDSKRWGATGTATLDINNPDVTGKTEMARIGNRKGHKTTIQPGDNDYFRLIRYVEWQGVTRLLHVRVLDATKKKVYYNRRFFWDLAARSALTYVEKQGLPFLSAGFYPSFGNKLKFAVTFNRKLPCYYCEVTVNDSKGKVLKKFKKTNYGKKLPDFEIMTVLPKLPLGDYSVNMKALDKNGKVYTHRRTFAMRKFPWQNLKIGQDRIIIPPFKPLRVDKKKQEVHGLMTGFGIKGELWDRVYAEGENILASPVHFTLNGKPFAPGKAKLVSVAKDEVIYETSAFRKEAKLRITQKYDYDGFCEVWLEVIPNGKVNVNDFALHIPIKDKYVKYFNNLSKAGAREKGAPDLTIPKGEGKIKLAAARNIAGAPQRYFWLGGAYKGFSWMLDTTRNFKLARKKEASHLIRRNGAVTFTMDIVNMPTVWKKPFRIQLGFQPTPVKPRVLDFRQQSEWMYCYEPAKGSHWASMRGNYGKLSSLSFHMNAVPNNDTSHLKFLFAHRDKKPTSKEISAFVNDYMKRNKKWIQKYAPMTDLGMLRYDLSQPRQYGQKYFLHYQNPLLCSFIWKEFEMYKAEWSAWDYPVDDIINEYVVNQTDEYIDMLLYHMRTQARAGFDGMNFDCFPLGGGYNITAGPAHRNIPVGNPAGVVPFIHTDNMLRTVFPGVTPGSTLFQWRKLAKRTATMLYKEGRLVYGYPWVELHATNCLVIPVVSWCTTTITTERSSRGGRYQTRFPEGYIVADIAGTQAGIVPRTIFSTRGASGFSAQEETKTLIAASFAHGLMQHVDQGIRKGSKDYQLARDYVFSFGYGNPKNKTIAHYDKEKQPVICKNPLIRTTQVIRKDGKALIMIGNLGTKTKAVFDLKGLGYKKYKVTDVFKKKVLAKPEVDVVDYGFALLQVDEIK